ncbi:hypothetical protein HNY73_012108 [Argiope bruennichi]|uniref:Uncharacterized protein n=1 Tax=Argiope bruennichi TaxID=94029 RepID=A0A8T0EVG7_ARGBR|nr:hypothetical protein HNY73_012108 [Argiope bruennichi]
MDRSLKRYETITTDWNSREQQRLKQASNTVLESFWMYQSHILHKKTRISTQLSTTLQTGNGKFSKCFIIRKCEFNEKYELKG